MRRQIVVFGLAVPALVFGLRMDVRSAAPPQAAASQPPPPDASVAAGVREAAWSPDNRRIAVSWLDVIWTMTPEGKSAKRLVSQPGTWIAERDPVWSPDGRTVVFAASTNGEFDLWAAPAGGGAARRLTTAAGDERWPSFTRDGRVVFSHRQARGDWQLVAIAAEGRGEMTKLTPDDQVEWQGRVSPDGTRIAFVSTREAEPNNDADVWVRELTAPGGGAPRAVRVTRAPGVESHPAWADDNARVAYAASRAGQWGVWVSPVPDPGPASGSRDGGDGAQGRAGGARGGPRGGGRGRGGAADGPSLEVLASRHGGVPAWSPDGEMLLIATFTTAGGGYNGNPRRSDDDPPAALVSGSQHELWRVAAPRAIDENAAELSLPAPDGARWTSAFDQVWQTMKSLYYTSGPSAAAWDALRERYRPQMAQAEDLATAEAIIDRMIAEQPLMKPALESPRAMVSSGHRLASAAGALVLEQGGNVVDAGIAVSFVLGVVEPDASSIGGDGQAILFLRGMTEPVVVEYKDMTPSRATSDNPKLFTPTGSRTASDGPSVANIPGVVAGLDLLYRKYGSRKVQWADLIAPAIKAAEEGFILDEALPTTIAEGRESFAKYPEAAKIFLPAGKVPRPGDRFVNRDYAETLRTLAREGGQSFYTGAIARRIAEDMAANGGVITYEDLAQYRAIERKPLSARFRGHLVFTPPPPVSTGLQVAETLQILDGYRPRPGARATTDADYLHHAIEAWRVRDGGARIADPERWPVDLGNHLDPAHTLERFKLIDPKKVFSGAGGGRGGAVVPALEDRAPSGEFIAPALGDGPASAVETRRVQTGTTAFVVADAEGNMIAFTQTLSTWGGNYYVSKGLGFIYNDHFRGGAGRGGFGSMLPLMRSSTTSVPTLVFAPAEIDPGRYGIPGYVPRLAVGCAGNAWIPASVYSIILNVVDGQMTAQQAIEAPRFLIGGGGGGRSNVQIEDRLPRGILDDLESRGHSFTKVGRKGEVKYGYAALAVVNAAKGTVEGGADPRRSHATAAPGR
jgi:gamma-glutamyltranspeptidase